MTAERRPHPPLPAPVLLAPEPTVPARPRARYRPAPSLGITMLLTALSAAVFALALLRQHRNYLSNAFDLGFFDQIIWNTSHGRWFETTFLPYNFLGQHVEPVLLLYAAIYRVRADVEVLLVTQAVIGAAAALPLYVASRRLLGSGAAGALVAAAYLLSPRLHGAMLFDFHPEVMAPLPIFAGFALLTGGRPGWALAAFAAAFLFKEDVALTGLGFALVFRLAGYRRYALALAGGSLLYLVLVMGVVMPAVRGGPGDLQERYGYLGHDLPSVAAGVARHPDRVVARLAGRQGRHTVAALLGGQALLPLATPAVLAAMPLAAANLLSTHPEQARLELHYVMQPLALLTVATVLGAVHLAGWRRAEPVWNRMGIPRWRRGEALAALLLAVTLAGWWTAGPLGPARFEAARFLPRSHHAAVAAILRDVPPDAPVSAQSGLLPHLSRRRQIYEFPRLAGATYIVIDRGAWTSSQTREAGYDTTLADLPARGYCLLREREGVELYARGERCALR